MGNCPVRAQLTAGRGPPGPGSVRVLGGRAHHGDQGCSMLGPHCVKNSLICCLSFLICEAEGVVPTEPL